MNRLAAASLIALVAASFRAVATANVGYERVIVDSDVLPVDAASGLNRDTIRDVLE